VNVENTIACGLSTDFLQGCLQTFGGGSVIIFPCLFARVVNHVTEAQLRICGTLNGTAPDALPKVPPETADKATIQTALQASFAECDKAYASLTDDNILQVVTLGTVTRTRIGFAWANVSHDNEQYATLALYMRLRGLVPPSSEK